MSIFESKKYIFNCKIIYRNNNQVEMMKIGGNKKLKEFLGFCGIAQGVNKKLLYSSKLMNYYRKMVKIKKIFI